MILLNRFTVLEEFYHLRLKYYIKRKERYLEIYQAELVRLDNQVRFILGVVEGEIIVCMRKKAELVAELRERGFTPIRRVKPVEPVVGAIEDEVAEGSKELGYSAETATEESLSDYDYLLFMAISSIYIEKVKELCANKDKVLNQIEDLKKQSEKSLWWKDLDELEKALDDKDKREAEEAAQSVFLRHVFLQDKDKREAQQPAATKKRAPAREGQKPITDEMVDASPDKKVRKTRPLEVTKMRSSSLNSIQEESVSAESVEQLNK
ncbi:DNA topoisomerase 2-like isoform X2 [Silene latifolia]|uniref:DNA topoisomerase 2-like isoform X2 n=1 Tax=Silene latifolia TaxID=37657 RepID=UPI003D7773C1